jgi:hypothetical protein
MTRPLRFLPRPSPTLVRTRWPKDAPFLRAALATGGIVALRDSPTWLADRRSTIAGTALLLTVFGLAAILALVVGGAFVGRG